MEKLTGKLFAYALRKYDAALAIFGFQQDLRIVALEVSE